VRGRKKLSREELEPYQWTPPEDVVKFRWGDPSQVQSAECRVQSAEPQESTLDWQKLFPQSQPIEVEVGFGKGLFLVNSAAENPGVNYFGIEIMRKYQLYATTRLAMRELSNAKTCCADAKRIFADFIPAESVAAVHVYFPDPWWKKRHKKRLLMSQEFVELIWKVLIPGGMFHFATDVPDYFTWVQETMALVPKLAAQGAPEELPPEHDMDYLTNFERRFRKIGKPIHRERYQKI
jgi:tRNA (guanine-N7-)-methyltransferase